MAIFSQRYDGPDDQGVRDDPNRTRVAAGTTGPYSPAGADPTSYKNQFVSQLKRTPPNSLPPRRLNTSPSDPSARQIPAEL